ncbi:MAG: D-cysteine desulfhydrase family protein [Hungatella sp.]|nr:D-cysteine desulfhydrase family protein [Hungatella sp.]
MKHTELKKEHTGIFPTPLHKLENLSKETKSNIYIKRDDLSGLGFGGNKLRKLDYLVREAKQQGCTALMTFGGVQTNHGRQTAAVACKYGMKSIIVANMKTAQPPERLSGNLLLDAILDCDVIFMDMASIDSHSEGKPPHIIKEETAALRKAVAKKVIELYAAKGEKVYEMPAGGSTPLGAMGYFDAVKEILDQLKEMNTNIDYVVCSSGSNGTFAGLWLGAKYYNAPFEVIGSTVSPYSKQNNVKMAELINAASEKFELGIHAEPQDLKIYGDYWGIGYDKPDDKTFETIYRLARTEGLFVDPTYTGKGFTALLDLVETEKIPAGSNVLFIHTGGLPALFSEHHAEKFTKDLWSEKEHMVISLDVKDCM